MGGLALSTSMVWAQAFPFIALQFFEEGDTKTKDAITLFLIGSFSSWLLLNIVFFSTTDLSYLKTFFGTKTAPQYTCERFVDAEGDDGKKWSAAFENIMSYKKTIKTTVKAWVENNIARWQREKPEWFKIEMIPDDFLQENVLQLEGGTARRRKSSAVSVREIFRIDQRKESNQVHPEREE